MTPVVDDELLIQGNALPVYGRGNQSSEKIAIILLANSPSELDAPFKSVIKIFLNNIYSGLNRKIDVVVATKVRDEEREEYFTRFNRMFEGRVGGLNVSTVVEDGLLGKTLASAIGKTDAEHLAFLTPEFVIDRESMSRGLLNAFGSFMDFGVVFVKGHYGITSPVALGSGINPVSQAPYVSVPLDITSFGGIRKYEEYFPFRHLSTIRVKRSVLIDDLDFISKFEAGIDVALGAVAIHRGVGIKTTPIPFVNMLLTPPAPDIGRLKDELLIVQEYFPKSSVSSNDRYSAYLQGVEKCIENGEY